MTNTERTKELIKIYSNILEYKSTSDIKILLKEFIKDCYLINSALGKQKPLAKNKQTKEVLKCNHLWEFINVGTVECSECGEQRLS